MEFISIKFEVAILESIKLIVFIFAKFFEHPKFADQVCYQFVKLVMHLHNLKLLFLMILVGIAITFSIHFPFKEIYQNESIYFT